MLDVQWLKCIQAKLHWHGCQFWGSTEQLKHVDHWWWSIDNTWQGLVDLVLRFQVLDSILHQGLEPSHKHSKHANHKHQRHQTCQPLQNQQEVDHDLHDHQHSHCLTNNQRQQQHINQPHHLEPVPSHLNNKSVKTNHQVTQHHCYHNKYNQLQLLSNLTTAQVRNGNDCSRSRWTASPYSTNNQQHHLPYWQNNQQHHQSLTWPGRTNIAQHHTAFCLRQGLITPTAQQSNLPTPAAASSSRPPGAEVTDPATEDPYISVEPLLPQKRTFDTMFTIHNDSGDLTHMSPWTDGSPPLGYGPQQTSYFPKDQVRQFPA